MTTENFTWDNVIAAMRKAVETKGEDYVYPPSLTDDQCRYSNPDGTPSCIVGHVLAETTPEVYNVLAAYEFESGGSFGILEVSQGPEGYVGFYLPTLTTGLVAETERETLHLIDALEAAQSCQDHGGTWGLAYDRFLAVLGLDREDVQ